MKLIALIVSFILLITNSYSQEKDNYVAFKTDTVPLGFYLSEGFALSKNYEFDILKCEKLLNQFVLKYNSRAKAYYEKRKKENSSYSRPLSWDLIELKNYGRQYIPLTNNKGKEIIYLNSFCCIEDIPEWKTFFVYGYDGGNQFFRLKIDLSSDTIFDYEQNNEE